MTLPQQLGLLAVFAYLLGSVPFGLLVGKAKGIDPRTSGSKNIGATNVGRLLGGKFFAIVFTLDLLKGLIPMVIAAVLVRHLPADQKPYGLWMLIGAAAIGGHMASIFLKFKGGKGVATSAGVLLGLWPYYTLPGIAVLGVFGVVFAITRTVSLGSIAAAAAFAPLYVIVGLVMRWPVFGKQLPLLVFAVIIGVVIVWKHRSNIRRLIAGEEHSFKKAS